VKPNPFFFLKVIFTFEFETKDDPVFYPLIFRLFAPLLQHLANRLREALKTSLKHKIINDLNQVAILLQLCGFIAVFYVAQPYQFCISKGDNKRLT